uniref:Immunoglobulin V-set domain-containing protein n=1 Tax=Laticauda laticaudata TaxID=8630 RepID=A0A8C5RUS5_LATLA
MEKEITSCLFFFSSPYFFAGCILSCLLQMVSAQENLTVVSVPEYPIQGQSILLNVKENVQETFEECEWTHPSGEKYIFARNTKLTPVNTSQVVVMHQNCSLTIKNLRPSDQGSYTVKVTVPPKKQQEAKELVQTSCLQTHGQCVI